MDDLDADAYVNMIIGRDERELSGPLCAYMFALLWWSGGYGMIILTVCMI
jgi:hypothetical protein